MPTDIVIDLQGDHASASSKFIFCKMDSLDAQAEISVRYEDRLIGVGDN